MAAFPNYFRDPEPWLRISFGGVSMRASLVEINGIATKDAWTKQKSKETSGQVAVFAGTTWDDPELTFEAVDEAEFDDLRRLWEMLAPVPGLGGTGTTTSPATGGSAYSAKAQPKTSGVGSPPAAGSSAGSSNFDIPNNAPSKAPSVGPRPPTVSVQYLPLLWHGITAVARMEWTGPTFTATNSIRHKLKFIADKPIKPAGVGAMAPAAPGSQFSGAAQPRDANGQPVSPQDKVNKNAAAGAAGT